MSSKKSLVPEILPDPKRPSFGGGPRERVVRHVQTVLAGLALSGTALAEEPYRVVDPMPPPARCPAELPAIMLKKATRLDAKGGTFVDLVVYPGRGYHLRLADAPRPTGATIVRREDDGVRIIASLLVSKRAKEVVVPVSLLCNGMPPEKPTVKLKIRIDPKVVPGGEYEVTATRE